jgi:hypothetical protein
MASLYESGLTLEQIGKRYGITRERVRQILVRDGVGTRDRRAAQGLRVERIRQRVLDRRDEVLETYREVGRVEEVARRLKLAAPHVRELIDASFSPDERDAMRRQASSKANLIDRESQRAMLLADLRLAHAQLPAGEVLTGPKYDEWARECGGLSSQVVCIRFGTWNEALAAAGLPPSPSLRSHYTRISDEEIFDAIRIVQQVTGRARPSCVDYEKARSDGAPIPSLATVRNRRPWTHWLDALDS